MSETNDQPGGNTGLLDSATIDDPNTPADNPQKTEISHRPAAAADPAAPASNTGAPKTRPEYLPENFWNSEKGEPDLEGMAKSWRDLRAKISQGKHNAPADGKYDVSKFGENADQNPMANTIVGWAKDNGLSQAQFDDLVEQLQTNAQQIMADEMIDPAKEIQQLGPNGQAVINGMVDWARGMVKKGIWSSDDFEEFKIMGGTARGLTALVKLREAYEGRVPIEVAPVEGAPSQEELYQMVGDPRYKTDPAYRQRVERMFQQFAK